MSSILINDIWAVFGTKEDLWKRTKTFDTAQININSSLHQDLVVKCQENHQVYHQQSLRYQ